MIRLLTILFLALLTGVIPAEAQKKSTKKSNTPATKAPQKKATGQPSKQSLTTQVPDRLKAGTIAADKIDTFKLQVIPLVKFFESSLNFLADPRNEVSEKQTILSQSYLRWCWDDKVQIEDDLDENRLVPLYKDMPAYLTDVSFFFKNAKFNYTVQDVRVESGQNGLTYFLVTANRNLRGLNLNSDSVNSNRVRYLELNFDSVKQQMMIVSVYTTKLNEKDDMRNWWNALSPAWKTVLAGDMKLEGTMPMADIESFNDSLAMIGGKPTAIMGSEFYNFLGQIIRTERVDLSGNKEITDLGPLNKLSGLKQVNVAGTAVSDLMPLRNLNKLDVLDISHTLVADLDPLRFCLNLDELRMKGTLVKDLSVIPSFRDLTLLDLSGTPVSSLEVLKENTALRDLRLAHTQVRDLTPVSSLSNLEMLNISATQIESLDALKDLKKLLVVFCDSTSVGSLAPLDNAPGLQRVYCNRTRVSQQEAIRFLSLHPQASVIYESRELEGWWAGMGSEWQKIFGFYATLSEKPTPEQLHQLALIDSLNLTGRMTITTLAPLDKLTRLRVLNCQSTGVSDLAPLRSLTGLQVINAANTRVAALDPLIALSELTTLNLDNTQVSDLSPLYGLKKLTLVQADQTPVDRKDADKFADKNPDCLLVYQTDDNLTWWQNLGAEWKEVLLQQISQKGEPDKFQLQRIAGLNSVIITENPRITDLTPLVYMLRLTELQFSGTAVSRLDPVGRLPRLKTLRFPKNPVQDLTPVTGLPNLTELDFSNTQVEDLDALQNMMKLEVLKFSGTQVKNLKYLQKLVNLKVLEFYNTRVGSLDALEGMGRLESVKMFNTKVSAKRVEKFKETHPKCDVVYY